MSDMERIFQILTENSFLQSLEVCKEILQEIAAYCYITNGVKCDYFNYCGNFIHGITDNDYQEYQQKMTDDHQTGEYWDEYLDDRPFQYICTDCASKSMECRNVLFWEQDEWTAYNHNRYNECLYRSVARKCMQCILQQNTDNLADKNQNIDLCPTCNDTQCNYCEVSMSKHLCSKCKESNGITIKEQDDDFEGLRRMKDTFIKCYAYNKTCHNLVCQECYYGGLTRCEMCRHTFCSSCIQKCPTCGTAYCHDGSDGSCYNKAHWCACHPIKHFRFIDNMCRECCNQHEYGLADYLKDYSRLN